MAINWVLFAAGAAWDEEAAGLPDARLTRFSIESCRPILGCAPAFESGQPLLRVESPAPVHLAGVPAAHQFRGTVQHLNYTAKPQRADLEARSRAPFADPAGVVCVMIPIRKSEAWWRLAPEERTAHFQRQGDHHQHVAIGAPYVERVYRKLYHSRYAGGDNPYDFLTYFEFLDADRGAFEDLLAGLRDTTRNPEWAYVDRELEIWMRRA